MASGMDVMASGGCDPYVGRRAFDVGDEDFFFGRKRECGELVALCVANPVVVLHGPAGSGKTSLLRAGLTRALREDAEVLPVGCVSVGSSFPEAMLPDHNPHTLGVLSSWSPAESPTALSLLSLTDFLRDRALTGDWPGTSALIVAVIDQIEGIFADSRGSRYRDEFFADLAGAMRAVPRLRIVLSARSELLAALAPYWERLAVRDQAFLALSALERDAAAEAVRRPMEKAGVQFAPGVPEQIVDDLRRTQFADATAETVPLDDEGVEPVQLQVVCSSLRRTLPLDASVITSYLFDVTSHADRSLAGFCADVLSEIAAEHEMAVLGLRDWLERTFVTSRGTRGIVPEGLPDTAGMPQSVLRGLENRHLLTAEWSSGTRWYTLANDRLIAAVRKLNRPSPIESAPGIDAVSHLRVAVAVLGAGERVLAERHAWQALKAAGSGDLRLRADARSLLGNIAFERGHLEVAEEHYRRAAELSEQLRDQSAVGNLLGAIGRIHARQGRHAAALEDLQSAVTRLPGDLALQTELAKALWQAGQVQAAAAVFGTVLTIEPDFVEALAGRGQIHAERGNASSAVNDLRTLRRLRPSIGLQPEVRAAYALALARAGRPDTVPEAMEEADAALASAPDNGPIFLRAARVASASGALERANALLRRAAEASDPALSTDQLNEALHLLNSAGEPDV
jgi:tetratricopeptide (TPR) repeat protein